jgi:hypothetical protein
MMLTSFLCCGCCLFCLQFVGSQGSNCILNLLSIFTAEALDGQLQQQLQEGLVVLVGDMRQEEAAGRTTDARGAWPVKLGEIGHFLVQLRVQRAVQSPLQSHSGKKKLRAGPQTPNEQSTDGYADLVVVLQLCQSSLQG